MTEVIEFRAPHLALFFTYVFSDTHDISDLARKTDDDDEKILEDFLKLHQFEESSHHHKAILNFYRSPSSIDPSRVDIDKSLV
jgi:hypothetical protein